MKRFISIFILATILVSTMLVTSTSAQTPTTVGPAGVFGEWEEISTEALRNDFPGAGGLTSLEIHEGKLWAFGTKDYSDPAIYFLADDVWEEVAIPGLDTDANYAVSSAVMGDTLYVMINLSGGEQSQLWFHTSDNGWNQDLTFDTEIDMGSAKDIVTDDNQLCVSGRKAAGQLALACGVVGTWEEFDLNELGNNSYFASGGQGVAIVNGAIVIAVQYLPEGDWTSMLMVYKNDAWTIIEGSILTGENQGDSYWSAISYSGTGDNIFATIHSQIDNTLVPFYVDVDVEFSQIIGDPNFGVDSTSIFRSFGIGASSGFPFILVNRDGVGEMWFYSPVDGWVVVNDDDDFTNGVSAPDRFDDFAFTESVVYAVTNYDGEGISGPRIWKFVGFAPEEEETTTTTTTVPSVDDDGDNITNAIENAAPNGGDANKDGTLDSQQSQVTSFVNPLTGQYATFAVTSSAECAISTVGINPESTSSADATYSYPNGLMNFNVNCAGQGATITAEMIFYNAGKASDFIARKFINNSYRNLDGASVVDVTIGGVSAVKLTYSLSDGGPLDADGQANGTIIDPAGLAITGSLPATGSSFVSHFMYSAMFLLVAGTVLALMRKRKLILHK